MNIRLSRHARTRYAIDGAIYIDDQFICSCAESIHTKLKAGTYAISITKCKQYGRKMPVLLLHPFNSPSSTHCSPPCQSCHRQPYVSNNTNLPCYCPMIKSGNGVQNRDDGSIIVGKYLCSGALIHPVNTFQDLYERLRKSAERGHQLKITINDNYGF